MIVAQSGTNAKKLKETATRTMTALETWFVAKTIVVINSIMVMIVAPGLLQQVLSFFENLSPWEKICLHAWHFF